MERPKRTIRAPKPLYVPDENAKMEDDSSVDSSYDIDEDEGLSIVSSEDGSDEYELDSFCVDDDDTIEEEDDEEEEEEDDEEEEEEEEDEDDDEEEEEEEDEDDEGDDEGDEEATSRLS